jgi:glycosyltransferase involved in cell wall biosynthesis
MTKKIAILLNTPILGGAERSIVQQVKLVSDLYNCTFFIPLIEGRREHSDDLSLLIKENKGHIQYYNFPKNIYRISRSKLYFNPFSLFLSFFSLMFSYKRIGLSEFDIVWCNGNKVGLSALIYSYIFRYKNKFIWHFRDYPSRSRKFRFIWRVLECKYLFSTLLIGNSQSVSEELKKVTNKKVAVKTVYNPVEDYGNIENEIDKSGVTIGFAGMFAPWKGIHELVVWASIYEDELKNINVKNIKIFGDEIYLTQGEHSGYRNQLNNLLCKFPSSLIQFCGLLPPSKIYSQIDILVHTSINPEPFGRVITEAFSAGIPVISTGLGGAGELVLQDYSGLTYYSNDYEGLYSNVKQLVEDDNLRNQIISNAKLKRLETENLIKSSLLKILS